MAPIRSKPADFAKLEEHARPYEAAGRSRSVALLIWFLQTIYRLDEIEAEDAGCDKSDDLGIDAIAVSEDQREIYLFQVKRREKLPSTLGDTDLKAFVGALGHFRTEAAVQDVHRTTRNQELRNLIEK